MKRTSDVGIIISIISIVYWIYLIDPFKGKPQIRNYKKLINNNRYLIIHVFISSLLFIIGLYRNSYFKSPEFFSYSPLFFIAIVKGMNVISRKTMNRDFHLLIRGDRLKTDIFDHFASFATMGMSFVLALLLSHILSFV